MKKILLITIITMASLRQAWAFCGFYVAKADASLFNETSQVILVRDGDRTTVTMSSDFKGDVKDFAMVIPVPVVLEESDIRVADRRVFDKLDAYSAPRVVQYYDESPCYRDRMMFEERAPSAMRSDDKDENVSAMKEKSLGVTIEAKYTVGEYDILILSAKQSDGLKIWLTDNGYKIPPAAEQVLEPYIKSKMKFFVVKVNLEEQAKKGFETLRPLQISFNSDKFMLPLRLGMANSKGTQDMIVYAFSRRGRVEATNYRTAKIPTDIDIPLFVQDKFSQYYVDLFTKAWKREGENVLMLEYAWDLSGNNYSKCDPCTGTPPVVADMKEAGVDWLQSGANRYGAYQGDVFFTRLHVRYDRAHFPQDLVFQETPNREHFQGRYVMHIPATYGLDCPQVNTYYKDVFNRRVKEIQQLSYYTGWDASSYSYYVDEYARKAGIGGGGGGIKRIDKGFIPIPFLNKPFQDDNDNNSGGTPQPENKFSLGLPVNSYKYLGFALLMAFIALSLAFSSEKKQIAV